MRACELGEPDNYYTRNERDDARLDALADMFMVGSVVEQRASALDRKVSRAYKRKKKTFVHVSTMRYWRWAHAERMK